MKEIILIKNGELVLKGLNRNTFEDILIKNMRKALAEIGEFTFKKSHVLTAMKLGDKVIEKSIRISFSRMNTKADVDELTSAIRETVEKYPI